jgi:hypothetical protein
MEWSGAAEWKTAGRGLWMVNDTVAGYSKAYKNLEFLIVLNSGHLVPMNQPVNALDLIQRVLRGKNFIDKELPSVSTIQTPEAASLPDTSTPPAKSTRARETTWSVGSTLLGFAIGFGCALAYNSFRHTRYEYEELQTEEDKEGVNMVTSP